MNRNWFSEAQIIAILREQERAAKRAEVCRKYGVSSSTFYEWKGKYGGPWPAAEDHQAQKAARPRRWSKTPC
jgi:transposase-like protein